MKRRSSFFLWFLMAVLSMAAPGKVYVNMYDCTMAIKTGERTFWTQVTFSKSLKPCQSRIESLYTPPITFKPDVEYVNQPMIMLENGVVLGEEAGDIVLGESFALLEDLVRSGQIQEVIIGSWPLQLSGNCLIVHDEVDGASVSQYLSLFDAKNWEFSSKRFDLFLADHRPPFEYDLTPSPPQLELKVIGRYREFPAIVHLKPEDNGEIGVVDFAASPARVTTLSSFTYLLEPASTDVVQISAFVRDGFGYEATASTVLSFPPPPMLVTVENATTVELGADISGDILGVGTGWPGTSVVLDEDLSGTNVVIKRTTLRVVDRRPPELDVSFNLHNEALQAFISAQDEMSVKVHVWVDGEEIAVVDGRVEFHFDTGNHLLLVEAIDGSGNASRWARMITIEPRPNVRVVKTRLGWLLWRDSNTSTGWLIGGCKVSAQQIVLVSSKLPVSILSLDGKEVKVELP
ncbi:MAG: hypothetical protein J7J80_04265 [Thermotogae bacterium]|nr:hypothetical protein [Thermotogota bacterium]